MVVEVGGATTNVHSWSPHGVREGVILRGLVEPSLRRTVEGDLGVRWNAETILELAGGEWFARHGLDDEEALTEYVSRVAATPETLPVSDTERACDELLATFAGRTAIARHCGRQREVTLPEGPVVVQEGSDLRKVGTLIGTGGSVIAAADPAALLSGLLDSTDPFALVPETPEVHVDSGYALYAAGLLVAHDQDASVALAQSSLEKAPTLSAC
jgi:uncharacterized protein (TIGR01319 family)